MNDNQKETVKRKDNELGIPMRIVAALLALFGWKYVYLVVMEPEKYLEKGVNFQTVSSMIVLVVVLILLTMGAVIGKVPKKITDAARNYDSNRKK